MDKRPQSISVGIIGTGGMGGRHAHNLHTQVTGAQVSAIMDVDRARAQEVARACGDAQVFLDAHQLIESDSVDAVVIASPDATHVELTLACLQAGKPVLCEKPLATTAAAAWKVVQAELGLARRRVQVGFMRHYDPQHVGVKQAVESGVIGRPILFKGWHRNRILPPGFTSEALIVNAAVHDLDSARWLLAQEVEEVFVRGVNTDPTLGRHVHDLQLFQLSMAGDCLATIEVYVHAAYGYEVEVELVGEHGTAHTAYRPPTVIRHNGVRSQSIDADWLSRFRTAYIIELQSWIASLHSGRPDGPNAWDGYVSLVAAEHCIESLRSGLPQRLPALERPALYPLPGVKGVDIDAPRQIGADGNPRTVP